MSRPMFAVLAGLTGNATELARHVRDAERLAEELRSPVLAAWTNEVSIEYASGIGDWEAGQEQPGDAHGGAHSSQRPGIPFL